MNNNMNLTKPRKTITICDGIIILIFLVIALSIVVCNNLSEDEQLEIVVKKDSEIVDIISFEEVDSPFEVCIDDSFDMIILAETDGVSVISSECDDKVCVNTGKITKQGQSIVCLPAHVSVELRGNSDSQLDGVVG